MDFKIGGIGEAEMSQPKRKRVPKFFTWTLKISVHRSWVADGFDFADNDEAHDRVAQLLPHAYGHEFKARVLKQPDRNLVAREQGYKNAVEMKKAAR